MHAGAHAFIFRALAVIGAICVLFTLIVVTAILSALLRDRTLEGAAAARQGMSRTEFRAYQDALRRMGNG